MYGVLGDGTLISPVIYKCVRGNNWKSSDLKTKFPMCCVIGRDGLQEREQRNRCLKKG